ncbi:hypothetical protein GCM10010172_07040 [Paractinoplanes ferrugineus]|uniref:HTH cro/C1-type domain-containing protein n=1 Tax=Paractinoplanes ferrugineus TaxID=113564 RepID=A0A919J8V6_9ACTN|nr:helix-turn-helix transcriptional regulator [Actinoplanes ferrugineus]GIE16268.1 hypothetical protein Afe05nite_81080 [Actinoplanes ferrugineus]
MTTETQQFGRVAEAAHETCDLPPPKLRRELRQLAGLTQEDVAHDLGVSDGAVSYWERRGPGRRHRRQYLVLLIRWATDARALGLPVLWPAPPSETELQK